MARHETNQDDVLALSALIWTISDEKRAERLMALTGLEPDDLRARVGDPDVLVAVLGFLEAHEPDLIACAASIDTKPETLVAARERMSA
jgi:Protein of unknown function (DUF3572)